MLRSGQGWALLAKLWMGCASLNEAAGDRTTQKMIVVNTSLVSQQT